jgi:group I intron endonuclease
MSRKFNPLLCGVYEIRNVKTGKRYVGSSINIPKRLATHKRRLSNGSHTNKHLQNAWDLYGEEFFEFNVLAILERCELLPTEQRLLNLEHQGETYNLAKNAEAPGTGISPSEETRQKLREKSMGNKHALGHSGAWSKENPPPNLAKLIEIGRNHSPETIKKISEAKKGKPSWNKGIRLEVCQRGHEFTPENTYITSSGKHNCKACIKLSRQRCKDKINKRRRDKRAALNLAKIEL